MNDMIKKVESAIPVQSRIDIRALAEMAIYWESIGKSVRTMSQLVNWSVDLCSQILKANGMIGEEIDSVTKANNALIARELYQHKVMGRGRKKLVRTKQLENLRLEGVRPETGGTFGHNEYVLSHNKHSVEPAPDLVKPGKSKHYDMISEELDRIATEERNRLCNEAKRVVSECGIDENGHVRAVPTGYGTYTQSDKERDDRFKQKMDVNGLVQQCEVIHSSDQRECLTTSTPHPGPKPERPKPKSRKGDEYKIASMTDAQLEEKECKRAEKDAREKAAMDAMLHHPPKPTA